MAAEAKAEARRRVPAAERRDALIEAAVHHFGHGGLQGTKVSQIARDVGVAQPYVFSLFPTKRDLFIAAVGRGFEKLRALLEAAAKDFEGREPLEPGEDVLRAMGSAYVASLDERPDLLLLQMQAYAASVDDAEVQATVRHEYAELVALARRLSGVEDEERLDLFFQKGMWLNVAAALGLEDFSVCSGWVDEALKGE